MPNKKSSAEELKENNGNATASPTKKKKNRIRNRKRNKCNRQTAESKDETTSQFRGSNFTLVEDNQSEITALKNLNQTNSAGQILTATQLTNGLMVVDSVKPSGVMNSVDSKKLSGVSNVAEKSREEIMAEREAKKLAKQAKKGKVISGETVTSACPPIVAPTLDPAGKILQKMVPEHIPIADKTRDEIKAEREAKKQAKQAAKSAKAGVTEDAIKSATTNVDTAQTPPQTITTVPVSIEKKKPTLTKAERRAVQEAQRAAKAQVLIQKQPTEKPKSTPNATSSVSGKPASPTNTWAHLPSKPPAISTKSKECKVKLFNHLESAQKDVNLFVNNAQIHPNIARLGEQYAKRTVVGSNARCIAFLNALKMVIQDFQTPPKKEFSRSLEVAVKVSVEHLQKCRPLAVSVHNAYKHIKHVLTQLPSDQPESELKENLCHFIDTYVENQIGKAAQAISSSMQEKIKNGDVILTFGCSSLINYICEEAHRRHVAFRVIIVDSRPFCEGQELLRRLSSREIPCTYVLINAVGFVMPEATKVLLGAHALLSNGYVMARTGTAQVALVARSFNVPVLVCCETHKFSERFQTDAIVYNELGDPHDLVSSDKCCLTNWQLKNKISPLNLIYDVTPPELVTAVVTEVSILPCTSVPVILRIKPTEIGYYN